MNGLSLDKGGHPFNAKTIANGCFLFSISNAVKEHVKGFHQDEHIEEKIIKGY